MGKRKSQKDKGRLRGVAPGGDFDGKGHDGDSHKQEMRQRLRIKQLDNAATKAFEKGRNPEGYLAAKAELASACREAGMMEKAVAAYEECMKLDPDDKSIFRRPLVSSYLEVGFAEKARALMEQFSSDTSTVFRYSNALIEFISWKLLGEPGASRELAAESMRLAFAANQYVAIFLTCAEVFLELVTGAKEIRNARQGTVEDAFEYCAWDHAVWLETEGAREWLAEQLQEFPDVDEKIDSAKMTSDPTDLKYFDMYVQAMHRLDEEAAEQGQHTVDCDESDSDSSQGIFDGEGQDDRPWH